MNEELKEYIKINLKQEKKKNSGKAVLFPHVSLFSSKIKNLLAEDCTDLCYEENNDVLKKCKGNIDNSISHKSSGINKDECDAIPFLENRNIINIDEYIKENEKYNDFQTNLFKMIDEKNLIDSDVYNKVHIDRRLFSKIRNDKNYHPSKETILLLGLSMELNEQEIENLLDSASYSLPRNNHYDLIMRFCFMKGIYKLIDVNDLLDQYNCKLFNY